MCSVDKLASYHEYIEDVDNLCALAGVDPATFVRVTWDDNARTHGTIYTNRAKRKAAFLFAYLHS